MRTLEPFTPTRRLRGTAPGGHPAPGLRVSDHCAALEPADRLRPGAPVDRARRSWRFGRSSFEIETPEVAVTWKLK